MLLYLLAVVCLSSRSATSVEPHETQQLLEQYDQNAQGCADVDCSNDELDSLDTSLLMLLGRRAAVVRQRSRIVTQLQLKGGAVKFQETTARLLWLAQKAQELGVPKVLSEPVMQALLRATETYERQHLPRAERQP